MILLFACAGPQVGPPEPLAEPTEQAREEGPFAPAGEVVGGVYRDRGGFSVEVLEGWVASPGSELAQRRLTMEHVPTGVVLAFAVYPEARIWPRERAGCHWTFRDSGPYGVPRTGGDVTVGTCTPREAPDAAPERVLGWFLLDDGLAWHLEAEIPRGYLAPGRAAAEEVLATFRLP